MIARPSRWLRPAAGALLAAHLSCAGCAGTEVGNPVADVPLSLTVHASDDSVRLEPDAGAGGAQTIEELWVSLGDIRFVLDDDCASDRDARVTLQGPLIAELAHGPAELHVVLEVGDYCRVRVPFERATDADPETPAELVGHSTLVRGLRADGVPFQIRSRAKPDLVLRSKAEPFRVGSPNGAQKNALVLAFDAAAWLAGLDLAPLSPNADGVIVIDSQHETASLRAFETNLRESLGLFRDLNANGELDGNEPDELLAE